MFERVITQTIQRISSEVLRDRQSVPLTEILEDERIPSRFKPFFATEVRWWLYNDALARSANKRFDVDHPEVASLLDYLEQVMFRHARFEHDEFVSTLDGAVKLTFNYLCRPQTTLKWYIFRGQPVKPLSEVMLRFESFLDYEYIGNVFAEWVERKVRERATFEAISATEFERIIRRIDDQILLSCTVDELLGLLDPIFDFIGEGEAQFVPLDALIIFFDDKNIARLVDHLERYRETDALVSRARFVGILEELLTSAEENPEADFSSVYQNDELDDIVQRHLEAEGKFAQHHTAADAAPVAIREDRVAHEPLEVPTSTPSREPPTVPEPEASVEAAAGIPPEAPRDLSAAPAAPDLSAAPDSVTEPAQPEVAAVYAVEVDALVGGTERAAPEVADVDEDETGAADTSGALTESQVPEMDDLIAGDAPFDDSARLGDDDLDTALAAPTTPDVLEHANVGTLESSDAGDLDDAASIDDVVSTLEESPAGIDEVITDVSAGIASEGDIAASRDNEPVQAPRVEPASVQSVGLDPMLERKVLKKIFNRDRSAYDEAMMRLAGATTWRQASQVLDEIFIRFDVDPYSRTALRFTDSIYTRYVPTSHN
jgi:hypothetical protein